MFKYKPTETDIQIFFLIHAEMKNHIKLEGLYFQKQRLVREKNPYNIAISVACSCSPLLAKFWMEYYLMCL